MFYSIKEKGSFKNLTLYSIGIIFSLLSFNTAQALYEGRYGKPLDISRYNMMPIVGSVAFSAKNPKNLNQNILFVPSSHILNLRFLDSAIIADIKAGDILITESSLAEHEPGFVSWDPVNIISNSFRRFSIAQLEQSGLLKKTPFLNSAGIPWTFYLKPETKNFLTQNFQPESTLNLLSPIVVSAVMERAAMLENMRLGMDLMTQKDFLLKGKPMLELDTYVPLNEDFFQKKFYDRLKKNPMTKDLIQDIDAYVQMFVNVTKKPQRQQADAVKKFDARVRDEAAAGIFDPEDYFVSERNAEWIPKLLKYFNDHPDKKIVVMVGAGHFEGRKGLLKLLEAKGFKFTEGP